MLSRWVEIERYACKQNAYVGWVGGPYGKHGCAANSARMAGFYGVL